MARGEGFYCSDPWCDGDHPLPSQSCEADEEAYDSERHDELMADSSTEDDGTEHHVEPPC